MSGDMTVRLGVRAVELRRKALSIRIWCSLVLLVAPLIILPLLASIPISGSIVLILSIAYLLIGIPLYIVVIVHSTHIDSNAALEAGKYLRTEKFAHVQSVPKVVLRGSSELVDSWLATNHIPNPALREAENYSEGPEYTKSETTRFHPKWSGMVIGGSISSLGIILALVFCGVEVASVVSGVASGFGSLIVLLLSICLLIVGLSILYYSAGQISRRRLQWEKNH